MVRDLAHFELWLTECGAEVLDPRSKWEILRVKTNTGTHVVHVNKDGNQRWPDELTALISRYSKGQRMSLAPGARRNHHGRRRIKTVLQRDGSACFYCGKPLPQLGEDAPRDEAITPEHLVSRSHGGPDHVSNIFLAHALCNERAGNLSAPEKIRLRDQMRCEAA